VCYPEKKNNQNRFMRKKETKRKLGRQTPHVLIIGKEKHGRSDDKFFRDVIWFILQTTLKSYLVLFCKVFLENVKRGHFLITSP